MCFLYTRKEAGIMKSLKIIIVGLALMVGLKKQRCLFTGRKRSSPMCLSSWTPPEVWIGILIVAVPAVEAGTVVNPVAMKLIPQAAGWI
jgi:hypothetical protein